MWTKVYASIKRHPKVQLLAEQLDIPQAQAIGHLVCLWIEALNKAPDGNLNRYNARDIAYFADYDEDPIVFAAALISSGWLDETDSGLEIHDWADHMGSLKNTRRMQEARKKNKDGNVCRTCAAHVQHKKCTCAAPIDRDIDRDIDIDHSSTTEGVCVFSGPDLESHLFDWLHAVPSKQQKRLVDMAPYTSEEIHAAKQATAEGTDRPNWGYLLSCIANSRAGPKKKKRKTAQDAIETFAGVNNDAR